MQTTTRPVHAHWIAIIKRPALGRSVLATGMAGLGLQHVLLGNFPPGLGLMPASLRYRSACVIAAGILAMLASIGILACRRPRLAALALTTLLAGDLVVSLPRLVAASTDVTAWVTVFELIALAGSTLVAAASAPAEPWLSDAANRVVNRATRAGIAGFGLSSVVFGIVHFLYAPAIANLIPAWIPAAPVWAYLIGALRVGGGPLLVTPISTRPVATCMALMYGTWVLILHLPRVAAHSASAAEWTLLLLAVCFCGGAWTIATSSATQVTRHRSELPLAR